jgi:type I restriction enzyme, S subunit
MTADGRVHAGWILTPFGQFLTPNKRPYTLASDEDANLVGMRWYGLGPFYRERKSASQILKKSHFIIRNGDVIYNKLFAWRGSFGIVPAELDGMYVSDKFPTYELDTSQVDPGFLQWYFRYPVLWEQARRMSTGSAALSKLTLNPPRFLELTLPLPSKEEQVAIARRLASVADSVGRVQELMAAVRPRAEAVLMSALDRRFQHLADKWHTTPLSEVVDKSRGISYGIVQTGAPHEEGVPTLRAGDLRPFEVLLGDVKKVDPGIEANYRRTRLAGREVLLRIRGGLGEVAICPPELVGGNVSREIAVIPVVGNFEPEFIMYAIASPSVQVFLHSNLRGTSHVGINLKDVRRVEIPVVPKDEQREVVQQFDNMRRQLRDVEGLQSDAAVKADAVLPSLLDRILRL